MSDLSGLSVFERGEFPRWARVRQHLDVTEITDPAAAIAAQFARPEIAETIKPGMRVAITCGSRGIDRIDQVIRGVVAGVKSLGGDPFVVPAMGSHGGATAEGQEELIAHYGVTEELVGAPVRSSMETVLLGEVLDGVPVYFDKIAYTTADAVIPVGRVKPHTAFRGPVESGLMKMLAIGLGKQKGADYFHSRGFAEFHRLIPAVGEFTLTQVNIPFGIALVENGVSHLAIIEAVPARQFRTREEALLKTAFTMMPKLPGETIDLLIIDQIGKDISGDGADPNVVNRDGTGFLARGETPVRPAVERIFIRDLTDHTEGNASGVGIGDFLLKRVVEKFDPVKTYMNLITAKSPGGGRLGLACESDRQALYLAIASCLNLTTEQAKIVRIESSKNVEELWVSEPMLPQLTGDSRYEVIGDLHLIPFDA
ncbi:MAG: DUF2088 domain-containing protein, partial [Thermomicrobiales bacterium]|nr:DUF2088 domain-containing protein [Thermomicrobiales bacterium]